MERITREILERRLELLNQRMETRDSSIRYSIGGRNGMFFIDREKFLDGELVHVGTVRGGTKRELADYIYVMQNVLDDAKEN